MLVFEKSRAGRGMSMLPACDVEIKKPGEGYKTKRASPSANV